MSEIGIFQQLSTQIEAALTNRFASIIREAYTIWLWLECCFALYWYCHPVFPPRTLRSLALRAQT